MNRDNHILFEAYKNIREQDSSYSPIWKKIAWNLGINPGDLTQDQVDKLVYDQKKRDISFGGFQAMKDYENNYDDKYEGYASIKPHPDYRDERSPEKIRLDYIRRLDGLKPGDPLSYYNTKNPNWMYAAYRDEKNGVGPFSPNWNYERSSGMWNNGYNNERNKDPLSFNNIYRNPFNNSINNNNAGGNSLNALSSMVGLINSVGTQNQQQNVPVATQSFGISSPQTGTGRSNAVSDYVNKFKQNMDSIK